MISFSKTAIAAVSLIGISAGIAVAAPAMVEQDSNVRQGPGTNYAVQDVLREGTVVDVDECRNGWCAVHGQRPGFVAESLLSFSVQMQRPTRRVVVTPGYGPYAAYPQRYGFYDAYPPGYYADLHPRRYDEPGLGIWFGY